MIRVLQLTLVLVFSTFSVSEEDILFSNSWAVEVRGGSNVAEQVARRHGFVNKGQVRINSETKGGCFNRQSGLFIAGWKSIRYLPFCSCFFSYSDKEKCQ